MFQKLLLDESPVSRCKALAEYCALAKASLTLGGFNSKVVAMIVVIHFDLTGTCTRKSLRGCLVRLDLSHFYTPLHWG